METSFIVSCDEPDSNLQRCLSSLGGTLENCSFECIVVGNVNPLTDNSRFGHTSLDNVSWVQSHPDASRAQRRNFGALHAKGDYLAFIDSELEFEQNFLSPLIDQLKTKQALSLVGSRAFPREGETELPTRFRITLRGQLQVTPSIQDAPTLRQTSDLIRSPCLVLSRSVFHEVGGFDEAYAAGYETFDLCFRLASIGRKCCISPASIVRFASQPTNGPSPINQALDQRYFQRRWQRDLQQLAAKRWTSDYLARLVFGRSSFDSSLVLEALLRWTRILSSPPPSALRSAKAISQANEIRWANIIENKMPSDSRRELSKKYGNWLSERISLSGFFQTRGKRNGVWLKEVATLSLPCGLTAESLRITGEIHAADHQASRGRLGLRVTVNQSEPQTHYPLAEGPFSIALDSPAIIAQEPSVIRIQILGAARANAYAYLGRKLEYVSLVPRRLRDALQKYRPQTLNQRLCIHSLWLDQEQLLDFENNPSSPQCFEFVRDNSDLGINLVGWHTAELGVGESARLAAKALQASKIAHALVPLKATCLAQKGDTSLSHLLQEDNPYPINLFHIDAPQSKDIDRSHGDAFRRGKYNIGYWAWELPEFPDAWIENFKYFDEIWTPSNFVRDAIAAKSPIPVLSIPHCIDFPIPEGDFRPTFELPSDKYLFCFAYDLNSYQSRKNPQAVIEAYRLAFLASDRQEDVGLVIKTQARDRNPEEYAKLLSATRGLPNCYLIDETLPRASVYGLMNACDCYVSLHRSEGFGLTVAESMFLGKPVVSTNWSATSEFLDASNGCPVAYELTTLEETFGPYAKGQTWADPSPEDAARYLQRLVNDSAYAQSIGSAAASSIREHFSPARVASLYEARLKAMCAW